MKSAAEAAFFFCENLAGGWLATRGYGLFKKVCEKSYSMIIYRNRVMIIMYWVPLMNHYIVQPLIILLIDMLI